MWPSPSLAVEIVVRERGGHTGPPLQLNAYISLDRGFAYLDNGCIKA